MSADGTHDWLGQTLSERYHVIEKLGAGGMGTVFKASDTRLDVDVVIKVPHPVMIKDAEFAARFRREIRSLVKLSHPNIVKVMDVGVHDGLPFAVMQFLAGGSLEDRTRPCTVQDTAAWLPDVSAALDFMHANGLVHRDIKPGNILFDSAGRAYLGDFGIAKVIAEGDEASQKLTGTGALIGTAEYMAPEMLVPAAYQETYDERVDQYSLAVTVYEMLSGRPPFRGDSMAEVAVLLATKGATQLHERNAEISDAVSRVVARAMRKKPPRRYKNCTAFAESFVNAVQTGRQTAAVKPSSQRKQTKTPPVRRNPTRQESSATPAPRQTKRENRQTRVRPTRNETQPDYGETVRAGPGQLVVTDFINPPPVPGRPRRSNQQSQHGEPQADETGRASYVLFIVSIGIGILGFLGFAGWAISDWANGGSDDPIADTTPVPTPTYNSPPDISLPSPPRSTPPAASKRDRSRQSPPPAKPPAAEQPRPKKVVTKKTWRGLYGERFGDRPSLRASLLQKRIVMVARIKATDDREFLDRDVMSAMSIIPMELFCPASQISKLYDKAPVPIGYDETISQPELMAIMLTVLQVNRGNRVLELKTGSGYQTALLAQMGANVYSLETDEALGRMVAPTLNNLGFGNLHYIVGGDAYAGLPNPGSFDRIIATAAYPRTPTAILRQLKPGGRFIAPVGDVDEGQFLVLYTKSATGATKTVNLLEVAFGTMPR